MKATNNVLSGTRKESASNCLALCSSYSLGIAEQAQIPEAFGLCRRRSSREIAELGETQLVILVGEQGATWLGWAPRRPCGMNRVDAAEVDIERMHSTRLSTSLKPSQGKGQVAAPAEVIEGGAVDGEPAVWVCSFSI